MKWSNIWELVKINILYSNPSGTKAVQKRNKKKKRKNASGTAKTILIQQIYMIILFLFIYLMMFLRMDFATHPGYFSFYTGIFFLISVVNGFSTLYNILYESEDLKLYAPLPVTQHEVFFAKILAGLGQGIVFLMPLLSMFIIAYWQIWHSPIVILFAVIFILELIVCSYILSITLVTAMGKQILKSPHRKLISTVLMFISTGIAIGMILVLNIMGNQGGGDFRMNISDMPIFPVFRGYYDVIINPVSTESLVHFWPVCLITVILVVFLIKKVMPDYYQTALYTKAKEGKKRISKDRTLQAGFRHHHLSTIGNATLLTQTFLMPLIMIFAFGIGFFSSLGNRLSVVGTEYFGIAIVIGAVFGIFFIPSSSFVGVGISLERENYYYLKSLPINFYEFLKGKFILFIFIQMAVPLFAITALNFTLLHISGVLFFCFVLGFLGCSIVQGQIMYRRDHRLLVLNWQDISQLFSRGSGQWLSMGLIFLALLIAGVVIGVSIFLMQIINPYVISTVLTAVTGVILLSIQFRLRKFWTMIKKM